MNYASYHTYLDNYILFAYINRKISWQHLYYVLYRISSLWSTPGEVKYGNRGLFSYEKNITALHSSRVAWNVNVAWLLKVSKVRDHAAVFGSHATLLLGPTFVTEITHPAFVAYLFSVRQMFFWRRCFPDQGNYNLKFPSTSEGFNSNWLLIAFG